MLHSRDETGLKKAIEDSNGGNVTLDVYHRLSGFYTRKGGKGYIQLVNGNPYQMAITYVHEMMHALMDSGMKHDMNDDEYAEEALAEFGMLLFMQEFCNASTKHDILFQLAYKKVKEKQLAVGLSHYGFGAELLDSYYDEPWLELAISGATLIGKGNPHYEELQKNFMKLWDDDPAMKEYIANELKAFLCDKAKTTYTPPIAKNSKKKFIMEFEINKGLMCKDQFGEPQARGLRFLNPGDILLSMRESCNPYDCNAIKLFWPSGRQLGYVPMKVNVLLAELMDMGRRLEFRVKEVNGQGSYKDRWVKIEVYR